MIKITEISKDFDGYQALSDISAEIKEGQVFGLIGTNGAGKSTLLRIISGIYKPNFGLVTIDDMAVWDNPEAKINVCYLSDNQYFYPQETPLDMLKLYKQQYPNFDEERFMKFLQSFSLDPKRKINTFSKGMKKQLSIFYGICANTKYLICDETFDGLDPVVRQTVKSLFVKEMESRNFTPIIASHNLRELEDICDHIGLLHKGGILFSKDLESMKLGVYKLQCVFQNFADMDLLSKEFHILNQELRGTLRTVTLRGAKEDIDLFMARVNPVFYELIPLSLEEIFITETEVTGYDFKQLYL